MLDLALALHRIGRPRVLVVGDFIYDGEIHCESTRLAQEASHCPIWRESSDPIFRSGGAGAVSEMAKALGADILLVASIMSAARKTRFFVNGVQVARLDRDARSLSAGDTDRLAAHVADEVQRADCVLIGDYGKGVCTESVLRAAIDGAKSRGIPCIADPHEHEWYRYEGATCLKMNSKQAKAQPKPLEACVTFPAIVITRGHEGISLGTHHAQDEDYPARPRRVVDVTGAGDMVLAALGVCIAGGMSWPDACKVANAAAGLKVCRRGAVPVPKCEVVADLLDSKIIPDELLPPVVEAAKLRGAAVWTNGCWDMLGGHHVRMLAEARQQGNCLIVGVNSDESVRYLKGSERPVRPFAERCETLAALSCVDYVVGIENETHLAECLKAVKADVLVKGPEWAGKTITGSEFASRVHFAYRAHGLSTTETIHKINESARRHHA